MFIPFFSSPQLNFDSFLFDCAYIPHHQNYFIVDVRLKLFFQRLVRVFLVNNNGFLNSCQTYFFNLCQLKLFLMVGVFLTDIH